MLAAARSAVGGAAALALLVVCAPPPAAAVRELARSLEAVDPAAPLMAAVTLIAWALVAWLTTAVLLTLLSRAPGPLGRASAALVRRWAPTAVRRSVEVALGLTAATGALGVGTAHALPGPVSADTVHPVVDQASATARLPTRTVARPSEPAPIDLDWPTSARTSDPTTIPTSARAGERTPRPAASTAAGDASAVRPTDVPFGRALDGARTRAGAEVAPATRPAPVRSGGRGGTPTAVVVRPGDTLWGLAETSLRRAGVADPSDSRIAQAWPHWWAANRDVIGDDPHLILPGTVLSPPADCAPGAATGP